MPGQGFICLLVEIRLTRDFFTWSVRWAQSHNWISGIISGIWIWLKLSMSDLRCRIPRHYLLFTCTICFTNDLGLHRRIPAKITLCFTIMLHNNQALMFYQCLSALFWRGDLPRVDPCLFPSVSWHTLWPPVTQWRTSTQIMDGCVRWLMLVLFKPSTYRDEAPVT